MSSRVMRVLRRGSHCQQHWCHLQNQQLRQQVPGKALTSQVQVLRQHGATRRQRPLPQLSSMAAAAGRDCALSCKVEWSATPCFTSCRGGPMTSLLLLGSSTRRPLKRLWRTSATPWAGLCTEHRQQPAALKFKRLVVLLNGFKRWAKCLGLAFRVLCCFALRCWAVVVLVMVVAGWWCGGGAGQDTHTVLPALLPICTGIDTGRYVSMLVPCMCRPVGCGSMHASMCVSMGCIELKQ
jgi:hypothetical protein